MKSLFKKILIALKLQVQVQRFSRQIRLKIIQKKRVLKKVIRHQTVENDLKPKKRIKLNSPRQRILLRVRRVLPAILQIPHQGRRQQAVLKVPSLGPLA